MCFPRYIQGNSNPRKFRFTFYLFKDLFQSTFIDRTTKIDRKGDNLNKQAEAEVVPRSSLVEVEAGLWLNLSLRLELRFR